MKMTNQTLPFSALERFLFGLGFKRTSIPNGYAFFHEPSGALIVLRHQEPHEEVSPASLAIVRHHLDGFGIMDRAAFDELIGNRSLVG